MSDSVRPQRRQPIRLPRPWDSPGKNTGVGCHFLLQCKEVKVKSFSIRLFATPWTAAYQAPLSTGFSRQEYWSGVPSPFQSCPTLWDPTACSPPGSSVHADSPGQEYWSGLPRLPPGDLPNPRIEHTIFYAAGRFLPSEPPGKPHTC